MSADIAPLISLIIATRERAQTLEYTLATGLNQASRELEVIVSDNASEDDTRGVVQRCADSRVRYFRTPRRLSMCDNYEFALEQARGRYVVFIGDDDAVMPQGLDHLISFVKSGDPKMIYMWPLHIYDWPVDDKPAKLTHFAPTVPAAQVDLKRKARTVMGLGGWKYYELPSPYHSAVPRQILDSIRARTGRVFHSTQPDVFTAMAIPAVADRAVNLGRTITLSGRSARSNGLGFVSRSARPNIERFIREYGDYKFHRTLYSEASGAAKMIPDAVLMARDLFPELYGDVEFNYDAMWAYMYRLKFVSRTQVLGGYRDIRRCHRFSASRFVGYTLLHDVAAARRWVLDHWRSDAPYRHAPSNILDLVNQLRPDERLRPNP